MVNEDILLIAREASLKISTTEKMVDIQHQFRWSDRSMWGVLLLLLGGIFFIVAPFIKTSDSSSTILGIVLGLLFFTLSILSIIRQVADKLKITGQEIKFTYNLKSHSILLDPGFNIKMETATMKISRVGTVSSTFISVTHYLHTVDKKIPILQFSMDNSKATEAIRLGNEITGLITEQLRKF